MTRQEIMSYIAEFYGIDAEDEEYDIRDYDWQAGCYINGKWLSLASVVELLENFAADC